MSYVAAGPGSPVVDKAASKEVSHFLVVGSLFRSFENDPSRRKSGSTCFSASLALKPHKVACIHKAVLAILSANNQSSARVGNINVTDSPTGAPQPA
jgi:hypothetical protein